MSADQRDALTAEALAELERRAAAFADYHRERASYGGLAGEFHARAETLLGPDVLALIAAAHETVALRERVAELEREKNASQWPLDAARKLYEHGRREERAAVVAWLRTTPRARGVLISIHSSQCVARLAEGVERGEHVPEPDDGGRVAG